MSRLSEKARQEWKSILQRKVDAVITETEKSSEYVALRDKIGGVDKFIDKKLTKSDLHLSTDINKIETLRANRLKIDRKISLAEGQLAMKFYAVTDTHISTYDILRKIRNHFRQEAEAEQAKLLNKSKLGKEILGLKNLRRDIENGIRMANTSDELRNLVLSLIDNYNFKLSDLELVSLGINQ